jgi:hypothetical protein
VQSKPENEYTIKISYDLLSLHHFAWMLFSPSTWLSCPSSSSFSDIWKFTTKRFMICWMRAVTVRARTWWFAMMMIAVCACASVDCVCYFSLSSCEYLLICLRVLFCLLFRFLFRFGDDQRSDCSHGP